MNMSASSLNHLSGVVGVPAFEARTSVLIAEDDAGVQIVLARMAQRAGLNTVVTSDGAEAFKAFSQSPTPLVITDLNMPHMDGLELLHRVKAIQPETFVVLVTANYELTLQKKEVDLVLKKPF